MGDPLDPVGKSCYEDMGYISIIHAIYQVCIRPYVKNNSKVLEIGPGRGAWTKTMLHAREIWCMDALSAEYNKFWEYVGSVYKKKIRYLQVHDFSCIELPDDYFDFLFSFGTFCHISWEGQCQYYKNLYAKMQRGATAIIMFADFDKYNTAIKISNQLRVRRIYGNIVISILRDVIFYTRRYFRNKFHGEKNIHLLDKNDTSSIPGKWYHAGVRETCKVLESLGWKVINPDLNISHRDPIIHFRKP